MEDHSSKKDLAQNKLDQVHIILLLFENAATRNKIIRSRKCEHKFLSRMTSYYVLYKLKQAIVT